MPKRWCYKHQNNILGTFLQIKKRGKELLWYCPMDQRNHRFPWSLFRGFCNSLKYLLCVFFFSILNWSIIIERTIILLVWMSVVYFDQPMGAKHTTGWLKSSFWCFYIFFHHNRKKCARKRSKIHEKGSLLAFRSYSVK